MSEQITVEKIREYLKESSDQKIVISNIEELKEFLTTKVKNKESDSHDTKIYQNLSKWIKKSKQDQIYFWLLELKESKSDSYYFISLAVGTYYLKGSITILTDEKITFEPLIALK